MPAPIYPAGGLLPSALDFGFQPQPGGSQMQALDLTMPLDLPSSPIALRSSPIRTQEEDAYEYPHIPLKDLSKDLTRTGRIPHQWPDLARTILLDSNYPGAIISDDKIAGLIAKRYP